MSERDTHNFDDFFEGECRDGKKYPFAYSAHQGSERDLHNFDNFFIGTCQNGEKFPFGVYSKAEADAKFTTKAEADELAAYISTIAGNLKCNSIGEYYSNGTVTGCCYVPNNQIVYYIAKSDSNTGELVCWNTVSKQEVWRHELELYRGASISYNFDQNMLFIASGFSFDAPNTVAKYLFGVRFSHPDFIAKTIQIERGVMYCAYDADDNQYYITSEKGAFANRIYIYIYDEEFEETGHIDLKHFPTVDFRSANRGVHLAIDGKLYAISEEITKHILEYDKSGNLLKIHNLPYAVNHYRKIDTISSLYYRADTNMIGILVSGNDDRHAEAVTFAETSIFHDIYATDLVKNIATDGSTTLYVENNDADSYSPAYVLGIAHSLTDALTFLRDTAANIMIKLAVTSENIAKTLYIGNMHGVKIDFSGYDCENGIIIDASECTLYDITVSGSTEIDDISASIIAENMANVTILSLDANAEADCVVYAKNGANVKLQGVEYSGELAIERYCGRVENYDDDN